MAIEKNDINKQNKEENLASYHSEREDEK